MSQPAPTNSAQYAFWYLLSLVALSFTATSVGMILYQVVNKYVPDLVTNYSAAYSSGAIKFAVSSIIIGAPIYFLAVSKINKAIVSKMLSLEAGIRRWLSYFILFVASVTILGYLVALVYSFLDGELTTKFMLKAFVTMSITAFIFGYYLYDIKRREAKKNDSVIRYSAIGAIVLVLGSLVTAFAIVESPAETRMRRLDEENLQKLSQIENEVRNFYSIKKEFPANLGQIKSVSTWLSSESWADKETGKPFVYRIVSENEFELCANFRLDNQGQKNEPYDYYAQTWPHSTGEACFKRSVIDLSGVPMPEGGVPVKMRPIQ
ncbi:MAG: hypothetical protein G01um101418_45 [Parcubacteria group bacterium Gr01-1014_18]|nr:MAG: hypothetical protein Greene041636_45 [Parcubacteria group bacterium Greene0416_36]TSC81551.1 MAG: hypothetical protein G01um101418_45 [Parcubacteria group bacterium Gr01-1014_18]TSC99638.1 MAG: hypothetical protein Greene101420_42 [Parcubacteria group bacterium Greene1014_20]TSD07089.1 MAG: hypothetical protein Greene07142_401 [Parcubacteria group bacterium Greene0714_2]